MDDAKKNITPIAIAGVVILALVLVGFYYWRKGKAVPAVPPPSATEALEEVESAAPDVGVPTSPIQNKIQSLNPVERVNPFKYENPLR